MYIKCKGGKKELTIDASKIPFIPLLQALDFVIGKGSICRLLCWGMSNFSENLVRGRRIVV
jgi:hypothetical protein